MRDITHYVNKLRANNHRITRVRETILDLLLRAQKPLSPSDIMLLLVKIKVPADKTTIYRELAFFKGQGMIRELQLGGNKKYYEIMPENHHHHIICIKCDQIEDIVLEKDLDEEERNIAKNKKFKIINHSLEFYGTCRGCTPII